MSLFLASSFDYLGNFLDQLPSFVASMLIAIICGLVIGLERESRGKPAGARTLVLICLGSAMFAQVSTMIAGDYGDPGRVAAQIVTGIGFWVPERSCINQKKVILRGLRLRRAFG